MDFYYRTRTLSDSNNDPVLNKTYNVRRTAGKKSITGESKELMRLTAVLSSAG